MGFHGEIGAKPLSLGQHDPWKRLWHERPKFCTAHTYNVAPHVFHSHRRPSSPYPPAWRPANDGATDHYQDIAHCAASGAKPGVFIPSRIFPAPMVDVGAVAGLDHVPDGPGGSAGASAPSGRRYGDRASWPPGVWQGAPARWGAVDSQLSGLPLRPYMGGHLDARQVAVYHSALEAPNFGRLVPSPGVGSRAWPATKTPAPLARRRLARLTRWFPERHFIFVGDIGYGTSEPARFCPLHRRPLTKVSKVDGDAAWSEPPPPHTRRMIGRPRVKGQQLASPHEVVAHTAKRSCHTVAWYRGTTRATNTVTGTGHWYRIGEDLVEVRWVYVHDCTGTHCDEYFFMTDITMKPQQLVACGTRRGPSKRRSRNAANTCNRNLPKAMANTPSSASPPAGSDSPPWLCCTCSEGVSVFRSRKHLDAGR